MKQSSFPLLLAVTLLSCCPALSQAQDKDYVVTQQNDTIYGRLKPNIGKIKLEHDGTVSKFGLGEIKSVYRAKTDMMMRNLVLPESSKPSWILCMEYGRINLYAQRSPVITDQDDMAMTFDYFYIQKDNSEIFRVKGSGLKDSNGKKSKSFFRDMIADNPDVLSKFDASRSFTLKKIRKLIELYNKEDPKHPSGTFR